MKKVYMSIFALILFALSCNLLSGEDFDTSPAITEEVPAFQPETIYPIRAPAEPVEDKWELWSGGTRLRGADLHPCSLYNEDGECAQKTTRQDLQDLRAYGANLVNASYPGIFPVNPPYEVDTQSLADLDNLVEWAGEVRLYVVIHYRTGPGRNEAVIHMGDDAVNDVWRDHEAQQAWIDMWKFTAEHFRDSPVVIGYDLMVEPLPNLLIDPDFEMDPEDVQDEMQGTSMDWNNLASEITSAIRQVDTETPIIVSSINWASSEWFSILRPTGDSRTVYSLHNYDPDVYTHQEEGDASIRYPDTIDDYGETIDFNPSWIAENLDTVLDFSEEYNVPIYVGEFGVARWVPGAIEFLNDSIDIYEDYGWNYAYYVWRGDEEYFDGFNLEFGPDANNHQIAPGIPLFAVFQERWNLNVDFPPP